jgi:nucleotide-binding universal stress UspA family protein
MISDVLLHVPAGDAADPGVDYGLSLAGAFNSHVTGVAFALEPQIPPAYFGALPADFLAASRGEAEKSAAAGLARMKQAAEGASLKFETHVAATTIDGAADAFGQLGRTHDLTVLTQPNPDRPGPEHVLLEAALFESGRGVLVVPYIQKTPMKLDRIIIAWDGGRAATRAVAEARPFLAKAGKVQVLVVEKGKPDPKGLPGSELAKHLARHNLKVELRRAVAVGQDVDGTILNEIADSQADLAIMGGYGHSRLREFVLGGVTRGMIQSMTAPVLMAH